MNRLNSLLLVSAILVGHSACQVNQHYEQVSDSTIAPVEDKKIVGHGYEFAGNGKIKAAQALKTLYTEEAIPLAHFPKLDQEVVSALKWQLKSLKYKKRRKTQELGNLAVGNKQLKKTIQILLDAAENQDINLDQSLKAHKIKGEDGKGNVHFTGYFTPIMDVRKEKSGPYQYPLYTSPKDWKGKLPSRAEIDGEGALQNLGLELAYAKSPVDIYFMQVQGSGIVEYEDGSQELFAYSGSNRQSYRSIGRYMINEGLTTPDRVSLKSIKKYFDRNPSMVDSILFANPSYVFFKPVQSAPKGAGLVPLTTLHSIAVDTRYIPLGSVLLAKVPIVNNRNRVIRHDYRILVAQDVGGAIKGTGHVDLYTGIGDAARRKASALHHYGNLWLLLPNEDKAQPLAMNL
ncbi:MAG: murein transglycosylase A [Bacteroidota bacterium]